ncbi:S8 family serine peptidase [Nocardioides sp. GCM10027113]|uniref:S8 family serine peptidase n=1 Tax=unclassified Nocardioides TaxID=2615069 RepID=UPI003605FDDA
MPHRPGTRASRRTRSLVRAAAAATALGAGVAGTLAGVTSPAAAAATAPSGDDRSLHLVTLEQPGVAGYRGPLSDATYRASLLRVQDSVLDRIDAERPAYRWTTALNGFAVSVDEIQLDTLRTDPRVAVIEENAVLPLASTPAAAAAPRAAYAGGRRGGAGLVVGVVDTGIWPESPLFSGVPGLGREPRDFRGGCITGGDWGTDDCNDKLVGARWFVTGFGRDSLRSTSSLSPRDDSGHGTQVASVVAGNAGVSVGVAGLRDRRFSGIAPQARVATYKACWTAPDPDDDGCATADVVTAVDRATLDGVDVLTLAVGGPSTADTLERALLGAAEHDVVVVAAAGNEGGSAYAAHPSPWVTTVGATTGHQRRGAVELAGGPTLTGAMATGRTAGPARLVLAEDAAADGATRTAARQCRSDALDVSLTRGAIVVCDRGGVGRVEKSATVQRADGVGMVLANVRAGTVEADLHAVPTVHLARADAESLREWLGRDGGARATLRPAGTRTGQARVTPWSSSGDPAGPVVKPDLVAPGVGVLGAVPPDVRGTRWDLLSGTSAATARTSGVALRLLGRRGWDAATVRSALVTSAASVPGDSSALAQGAGRLRAARAGATPLAYRVGPRDYRAWLDRSLDGELNTPSILLTRDRDTARRTITNVTGRALYFSSRTSGFTGHRVEVTPAAVRLGPGESVTFRVQAEHDHRATRLDDGWVTWRSGDGRRVRIPMVLTR